jgi:hypothetical protein
VPKLVSAERLPAAEVVFEAEFIRHRHAPNLVLSFVSGYVFICA